MGVAELAAVGAKIVEWGPSLFRVLEGPNQACPRPPRKKEGRVSRHDLTAKQIGTAKLVAREQGHESTAANASYAPGVVRRCGEVINGDPVCPRSADEHPVANNVHRETPLVARKLGKRGRSPDCSVYIRVKGHNGVCCYCLRSAPKQVPLIGFIPNLSKISPGRESNDRSRLKTNGYQNKTPREGAFAAHPIIAEIITEPGAASRPNSVAILLLVRIGNLRKAAVVGHQQCRGRGE